MIRIFSFSVHCEIVLVQKVHILYVNGTISIQREMEETLSTKTGQVNIMLTNRHFRDT